MRRQPVQFTAGIAEFAGREIALCQCGAPLSFDTDLNGYVIESCDRCHSKGEMTQAPRRQVSALPPLKPSRIVTGEPCVDCEAPTVWRGMGNKPKRCPECTDKRQREQSRVWEERHRHAKRAVA